MPTKLQLIDKRRDSYVPPPWKRCENCTYFGRYGSHCLAIEIRGQLAVWPVSPAGYCDLFTGSEPKPTE